MFFSKKRNPTEISSELFAIADELSRAGLITIQKEYEEPVKLIPLLVFHVWSMTLLADINDAEAYSEIKSELLDRLFEWLVSTISKFREFGDGDTSLEKFLLDRLQVDIEVMPGVSEYEVFQVTIEEVFRRFDSTHDEFIGPNRNGKPFELAVSRLIFKDPSIIGSTRMDMLKFHFMISTMQTVSAGTTREVMKKGGVK